MAIADRIEEMYTHVGEVYDTLTNVEMPTNKNIENIPSTIKKSYLNIMNNGYQDIWDNWDKVNGTGTEISIDGTEEAPMSLAYKGNTYQFTSNGTNLFNPAYVTTGATVSGNDITITSSGTGVVLGGSWASFSAPTIFTIPTGKKYLIPIINGEEVDAIRINLQGHYTDSEVMTSLSTDVSKVQGGYTLENPFEVTAIRVSAYGSTYSDLQGITFNFYVGSDNAYSPYGATPSPDYPSPVQVVSGDNSIEVVGKNLFSSALEEGSYDNVGVKFATNVFYRSADKMAVQPETTYTLSLNGVSQRYVVLFYNSSGTYLSQNTSLTTGTFTTPANTYYINIRCFQLDFTSDYANLKIQLEKGNQATTYEEYKSASYPISLGVENLLNASINKQTINGITFTPIYNDDSTLKHIVANGTASANLYFALGNVNVKANTSYLLSGCPANDGSNAYRLYAYMYDSNNTYLNVALDYGAGTTFSNADLDHIQVGIAITNGKVINNLIFYPMVELGTTKHSYTPYGVQPIQLLHIPNTDYYDKIDKSSGKNLFDIKNFTLGTSNGITSTIDGDHLVLNGTASGTAYVNFVASNFNGTCTWGIRSDVALGNLQIQRTGAGVVNIAPSTTWNKSTLDSTNVTGGYLSIPSGTTLTNCKVYLYVGEGTLSSIEYEPYGTNWYIKKEIGKVVLNGTEAWVNLNYAYYSTILNNLIKNIVTTDQSIYVMADHFKGESAYEAGTQGTSGIYTVNTQLYIRGYNSTYADINALKTFLSSNNTIVYYVLATPTYETITDTTLIGQLEALKKSYEGQTNISQVNNDLPFELDVVALSDGTVSTLSLGSPLLGSLSQPEKTQEEPEVDSEESL